MLDRGIKDRIFNVLREVSVQGDLFSNTFRKEDSWIVSIQSEVKRRQVMIVKLQDEIEDWKSREYKSNNRPITDTNKQIVSIGQVNERKRQNEISGRQQQIQRLKDEIVQLESEM